MLLVNVSTVGATGPLAIDPAVLLVRGLVSAADGLLPEALLPVATLAGAAAVGMEDLMLVGCCGAADSLPASMADELREAAVAAWAC